MSTQLLHGVTVRPCTSCRERGRLRTGAICPTCDGHRVIITRNNRIVDLKGPPPPAPAPRQPDARAANNPHTTERRQANSTCRDCSSPNLATRTLCDTCRQKRRAGLTFAPPPAM